jgi:hypothetical protein
LKAYLNRGTNARAHLSIDKDAPLELGERVSSRFPVFRIRAEEYGVSKTRKTLAVATDSVSANADQDNGIALQNQAFLGRRKLDGEYPFHALG